MSLLRSYRYTSDGSNHMLPGRSVYSLVDRKLVYQLACLNESDDRDR
jgi:hypothetical protein